MSVTIEKTGKALSQAKDALDVSRQAKAKVDAQVMESKREVLRVRHELVNAAAEAHDIESRINALEFDLAGLEGERRYKLAALERRQDELLHTLGALQRIGRTPPDLLLFMPASMQEISHARLLLSSVAGELDSRAVVLGEELLEMMRLTERISAQRDYINLEAKRLESQKVQLGVLLARKTRAYDRAEAQQSRTDALVADLADEAETLHELLESLIVEHEKNERAHHKAEAAANARRVAEQERSTAAEFKKPLAPPDSRQIDSISVMVETKTPSFQRATPVIAQKLDGGAKNKDRPREFSEEDLSVTALVVTRPPASAARGTFAMPARGEVISGFDETTSLGLSTKGIVIETRSAAHIVAPYDGRIAFAGHFREYGLLLIIDHGEGYHTLLAGMGRIDVLIDQRVLAGEPVAVMHSVADSAPHLYVELRSDGHPINPLSWLATETPEASG